MLYVVGTVNRRRIETFKRTSRYSPEDYDLLVRVLSDFSPIYTLAHVMAEVNNLTDLNGLELARARSALRETIKICDEVVITSSTAVKEQSFERMRCPRAQLRRADG